MSRKRFSAEQMIPKLRGSRGCRIGQRTSRNCRYGFATGGSGADFRCHSRVFANKNRLATDGCSPAPDPSPSTLPS
jgi:hypothetical protein